MGDLVARVTGGVLDVLSLQGLLLLLALLALLLCALCTALCLQLQYGHIAPLWKMVAGLFQMGRWYTTLGTAEQQAYRLWWSALDAEAAYAYAARFTPQAGRYWLYRLALLVT